MAEHDPNIAYWDSTRLRWLIIGVASVLVAMLGFSGFLTYFHSTGSPGGILDSAYMTCLLFLFQFEGDVGPKPWSLEVARFLAPAVTSYTVVLAILDMMDQRWQLTRLKGHVVVCGLGHKGVYLAKSYLRDNKKVVIIETEEDNDWIEVCRSLGAIVLCGDAADEDLLRKARAASAEQLIAVCEKDTTNIQIAMMARKLSAQERNPTLPPLNCLIHVGSLKGCASLRRLGVLDVKESKCSTISFNFFENSARALLVRHPLDREPPHTGNASRRVHLVLLEANEMSEALITQAIRSLHVTNHVRPRITLIDEHALKAKNLFYAQFPLADQFAEIAFRVGTAQDPSVRRDLASWAVEGMCLMTVVVCAKDEMVAMETALTLPAELREREVPIFVRLAEESGIAGILEHAQSKLGVCAFGSITDGCRIQDSPEATEA